MTNQTVITNSANRLSVLSTSDNTTVKKMKSNDFSDFMSKSLNASSKSQYDVNKASYIDKASNTDKTSYSVKKSTSSVLNDSKNDISTSKDDNQQNISVGKDNQNSTKTETDDVNSKSISDQNQVSSDDANDMSDKISKLEGKIQEIVKDTLGLSDDELTDAMSVLGLQMIDLLNPDNLKALALVSNGENDISALLTDENLANTVNNLITQINNIDLKNDFSLSMDQIHQFLEQKNMLNQVLEESSSDVTNLDTNMETSGDIKNQDNEKVVDVSNKQNLGLANKEPIIKVEKYTDTSISNSEENATPSNETQVNTESQGKSDASTSGNGNSGKELDYSSATNTLVNNLANAIAGNSTNFTEQIANVREMREIVTQIIEQVKVTIKPDTTSMEMNLNPESLGKVNLSVTAKDGIMTAHFIVQNETAREAIESQLQVLKQTLDSQGLKVDSVEVTVSNFAFDQSNHTGSEEEKKGSGRRKIDIDELTNSEDDLTELDSDILTSSMMEQSGGSVDFTA